MTKRLGRSFAELIETTTQGNPNVMALPTEQIKPNRFQPRADFDAPALEELKASIKQRGVIQPVLVRPIAHGIYELIAGERRWRAAQALGLANIPAVIRALTDQEALEFSLIENVQRENLNPVEEAKGFARLIDEFGYTQEQLAEALGKDRSSIANALRLLKLPDEIRQAISRGKLSAGHAKALLGVESATKQLALFRRTLSNGLSVRQLEALAAEGRPASVRHRRVDDPNLRRLEEALRLRFGTKVLCTSRRRGGRIVIEYFSPEDLARIVQTLGVSQPSAE